MNKDHLQDAKQMAIECLIRLKKYEYRLIVELAIYAIFTLIFCVICVESWFQLVRDAHFYTMLIGTSLTIIAYFLITAVLKSQRALKRNRQMRQFYHRKINEINKLMLV